MTSSPLPEIAPAGQGQDPADCTLAIIAGPQAGARLVLGTGLHRVGAGLDNDVVVCEATLSQGRFEIERGDATTLRACGIALRLADGTALSPGQSMTVRASLRFRAGTTEFRLAVPAPAARLRRLATPLAALAAAVAAVIVISAPGTESSAALGRPAGASVHAAPGVLATSPATGIAAVLAEHLAAAGLSGLQPTPGPDGTVTVSGSLSPGQRASWAGIRLWFDSTYASRVVLVDRVVAATALTPLSIAAVRPGGDMPFVIDQAGRRLFVGSEIGDGWVVAGIEPTRVMVRRNAEMLAVRF